MSFPECKRVIYKKNPLVQVICQLRFPKILTINTKEPAEFQDIIRDVYPQYEERIDQQQEISIKGQPDQTVLPPDIKTSTRKNHKFSSSDDHWHINLTSTFIALSTDNYVKWEDFSKKLEKPLQALIEIYKPAYFVRTGLRYIDAFDRSKLKLSNSRWSELIKPFALGFLSAEEISEEKVAMNNMETEITLDDGKSNVKIRANLGSIDGSSEKQYIIDSDFYSLDKVDVNIEAVNNKLDYLHSNSTRFIRWVIENKLHEAMEPSEIC